MFRKIRELGTEDSIIVLTGDIVHSKTDMSPELISLVTYLFNGCAELCLTYIIPGNHDFNLANPDRLDAISPIIEAIQNPNIIYIRDTEMYASKNIMFYHYSIMGDRDKWALHTGKVDYPGVDTHIALYHGVVAGAETFTGFNEFSDSVPVDMFRNYDITLLGDIHKVQYLNGERTIAYPGSLIQQDFGEDLPHGFLVWDVAKRRAEFIVVDNDHCMITIRPENGYPVWLPKFAKVRIITGWAREDLKVYVDTLKSKFSVTDIRIENIKVSDTASTDAYVNESYSALFSGDKTDAQIKLLKEFLPNVDSITFDKIKDINAAMNSKLRGVEVSGVGIRWKPIRFSFSNMFSYGENNVIEFDKMGGIVGLFAPNAAGKSTLLDSIVYCIFDKCSRTNRAAMVMNDSSDTFSCELEFSIGEDVFIIRRDAKRQNNGEVKVDVTFTKSSNGELINLNGKRRDDTNKIIRDYIGTYDDFVLTTLSSQNDTRSFIDMTKKERQELLYRFLNLHGYTDLYNFAKEESKTLMGTVKYLERENYVEKIYDIELGIAVLESKIYDTGELIRSKERIIDELTLEIEDLLSKKFVVPDDVDVDAARRSEQTILSEIDIVSSNLSTADNNLTEQIGKYEENDSKLKQLLSVTDEDSIKLFLSKCYADMQTLNSLDSDIRHLQSKLDILSKHEYDPNCEYCVKNQSVVDAKSARDKLYGIGIELKRLHSEYEFNVMVPDAKLLREHIAIGVGNMEAVMMEIDQHRTIESKLKNDILATENYIANGKNSLARLERSLLDIRKSIEDYISREDLILKNAEIEIAVNELRMKRQSYHTEMNQYQTENGFSVSSLSVAKDNLKTFTEKLKVYNDSVIEYRAYEYYMKAVNRDGIPYSILTHLLPKVEAQVNDALLGIVDYTFKLEIGDDETIDGKVVYGDREWSMELCSGMEKFILSSAIRSSLIKLSELPKPNFLAIDEGFGVLDGDKINSIHLLFNYFKKNFDFVLCISHISELRDYVDQLINIEKSNGYSVIRTS